MNRSVELDAVALVRLASEDVRHLVEESFVAVRYRFGDVIVREGDPADALYVIRSGQARVIAVAGDDREVTLNVLGPGDCFGEAGLLDERRVRTATVRASSEVEASRLDASVFIALMSLHPELRQAGERAARYHALNSFVRLQSIFIGLSKPALAALVEELEEVPVAAGSTVVRQGDPFGPVYLVKEGQLVAQAEGLTIGTYEPGRLLGQASMGASRFAAVTVSALTDCVLLRLSGEGYARVVDADPRFREHVARAAAPEAHHTIPRLPSGMAETMNTGADGPAGADERVGGEEAPSAEEKGPRSTRIRRFPLVWQVDEADCGAACVAMVCRHFGRRVGLARVREAVHTGIDGTSLRGIASGAEELGLAARTIKASRRNLDHLPMPALLHWDGNHWVVAYDVGPKVVRIADPALGLRRLPRDEVLARWTGFVAVLSPSDVFDQVPQDTSGLKWLLPFLRPHRSTLAMAILVALLVSSLELSLPVFTQVIVDHVLPHRDLGLLHVMLFALGGVVVLVTAGSLAQRYLLSRVALRADGASLDSLAGTLLDLPIRYFFARRAGDIQRRLSGVRQAREFFVRSAVTALSAAAQLLAAVALMFYYSRVLAMAYVAGLPVAAGIMLLAGRRLRPVLNGVEDSFGRYYSRQIDAIKGMETVKAIGAEESLRASLLAEFDTLSRRLFQADLFTTLYDGAAQLLTFLSLGIFLWVGSLQVLEGRLTLGGLVSFSALVALANGPVIVVLGLWSQGQIAVVLLNRISDVFVQEPEQGARRSSFAPLTNLSGKVELRRLTFRYGDPESRPILDGISIDVPAGSKVAVVGRSGCGKTTLARCLAGLVEPSEGQILYDGRDMSTMDYRQLRRQMGVVLQETFLFSDTIARNIAFGELEPDMERVVWAARLADAHDFVTKLPLGYDTRVGESGLLLSGGQRQRVSLARAAYHQPPVLILDEPTSSLDAESERAVKENLDLLLQGRTSFVFAHRLSTVRDADLIIVLENGHLVEQGSHTELMARRGLYAYLAGEQLAV